MLFSIFSVLNSKSFLYFVLERETVDLVLSFLLLFLYFSFDFIFIGLPLPFFNIPKLSSILDVLKFSLLSLIVSLALLYEVNSRRELLSCAYEISSRFKCQLRCPPAPRPKAKNGGSGLFYASFNYSIIVCLFTTLLFDF